MRLCVKIVFSLFVITLLLTGCAKETGVNIVSDLFFLGETSEGIHEFKFSIENAGNNTVKLEFPTYLEYNLFFGVVNDTKWSENAVIEHPSLDKSSKGRTVFLKPTEKLEYQILLKKLTPGDYTISIGSASGFGEPIRNRVFTID